MITCDGTYMCKCLNRVCNEWGDGMENKIKLKWSVYINSNWINIENVLFINNNNELCTYSIQFCILKYCI